MGSVTSGCFEDPAAAVHHGARHGESIKPQFVAGEHRFEPHSGTLPPQPVRGFQTWEREGGEGKKTRGENSPALPLLKHPKLLLVLSSSALWASLEAGS